MEGYNTERDHLTYFFACYTVVISILGEEQSSWTTWSPTSSTSGFNGLDISTVLCGWFSLLQDNNDYDSDSHDHDECDNNGHVKSRSGFATSIGHKNENVFNLSKC